MRKRSVNEKAVSKLINYLTELRKDLADGIFVTGHQLQTKHQVSKSTYSVCRKLNIITEDQKWNIFFEADRKTAIKILEYLRQQSDKQSDKPISDLWVSEILAVKELLTQIRDNAKKKDKGLNPLISSTERDRFEMAKAIASGIYSGGTHGDPIHTITDLIIQATDDLLKKLNE